MVIGDDRGDPVVSGDEREPTAATLPRAATPERLPDRLGPRSPRLLALAARVATGDAEAEATLSAWELVLARQPARATALAAVRAALRAPDPAPAAEPAPTTGSGAPGEVPLASPGDPPPEPVADLEEEAEPAPAHEVRPWTPEAPVARVTVRPAPTRAERLRAEAEAELDARDAQWEVLDELVVEDEEGDEDAPPTPRAAAPLAEALADASDPTRQEQAAAWLADRLLRAREEVERTKARARAEVRRAEQREARLRALLPAAEQWALDRAGKRRSVALPGTDARLGWRAVGPRVDVLDARRLADALAVRYALEPELHARVVALEPRVRTGELLDALAEELPPDDAAAWLADAGARLVPAHDRFDARRAPARGAKTNDEEETP